MRYSECCPRISLGTMGSLEQQRWTNLRVCKVEDAGVLWVREFPSSSCSEELQNFLKLEVQLNEHFKQRCRQDIQHYPSLTVGSHVVVYHKELWARGKIESVTKTRMGKARVFLQDYGCTVDEQTRNIVLLSPGEWTSVPYQTKRIHLAGVAPMSMQYKFVSQEIKLVLKEFPHWDPAATRFVESVFKKGPVVEFEPVTLNHDGSLSGKVAVTLPCKHWLSLLPQLQADVLPDSPLDYMTLDLALLLVAEGYAALQNDENLQTEQVLLGTRNKQGVLARGYILLRERDKRLRGHQDTSLNSDEFESSLSDSDVSGPSSKSVSTISENLESIPVNTYTSWCKNVESSSVTHDVPCESNKMDQIEMKSQSINSSSSLDSEKTLLENSMLGDASLVQCKPQKHSCVPPNSSEVDDTHTSTVTGIHCTDNLQENTDTLQYGSDAEQRLQRETISVSLNDSGNTSSVKDKAPAEISYPCESTCSEKSRVENQSYTSATTPIYNLPNKNSYNNFFVNEERKNSVKLSLKSQCYGYSASCNKFEEAQLRPHKTLNDFVSYFYIKPFRDTDLSPEFDASGHNATKNQNYKSGHEADFSRNSHSHKVSVDNVTNLESWFASFMLTDEGFEMDLCASTPEEGLYNGLIQQHTYPEAPDIAKLYRVFVTGKSHISEEEIIISKDMHSAFNKDIVSALLKRNLIATHLQAYSWPIIAKGGSVIIVGEKSCGKTMGFVVPLLSNILDSWKFTSERLPPGIGPVMVVVCSTWQSAKRVADYVVMLLPPSTPFKIMTAWGGCGYEEEVSTGKQLHSGCDILITTAPCLVRLLNSGPQGPTTTLKRCCHLVFDDIDVSLQHFPSEVKQIIKTALGERRRKCVRPDMELQVVLASTKWTELLHQLTEVFLPLLEPSIVISAASEAAIATKVASHLLLVSDESEALNFVMELIESHPHKRKMVFVSNDNLAEILRGWLSDAGMLCATLSSNTHMWKMRELVKEWHTLEGMTMILSHGAEVPLLCHDISNAEVLLHTHIGSSLATLNQRYSFMLSNFASDFNQKSSNCESYFIMNNCALEKLPGALDELYRICEDLPSEIKYSAALLQHEANLKHRALCYYLKAYGECHKFACSFRHVVKISDIPQNIPRLGEVTLKVIRTLNASRYLAHLIQYREDAGGQCTDLSNVYPALCTALEKQFSDPQQCEPLKCAEPGMLCAIRDNGAWARAQVISVHHRANTSMINVFFIDEGKQETVSLESARVLPFHLAAFPQLVVEVLLCSVKPMDEDHSWTDQANHFVRTIFAQKKDNKFIGRIVLALGSTLWLNPVAEFIKIGKTYVQKKAMREKLLSEKFGMDNPAHMKKLEDLCAQAGVSLNVEATCDRDWRMRITKALVMLTDGKSKEDPPNSREAVSFANSL